jgi:peptide/nickel transport system permease protein
VLAGDEAGPDYVREVEQKYGLDKPLIVQLGRYLANLARGDLGYSFTRGERVIDLMVSRLPATLLLMVPSLLIGIVAGTMLGAFAARHLGNGVDKLISGMSVLAYSAPVFWLGLLLIYQFSITLGWLPSSGRMSIWREQQGLADTIRHMVLPVVSLSIYYIGENAKVARASVANVMREDFMTTFRAGGLREGRIFIRHGLRNALIPIISVSSLQMAHLITGAVLTETVFSWPGMGNLVFQAVLSRDFPLVMGGYIAMSILVVVLIFAVDILYMALDPRIHLR